MVIPTLLTEPSPPHLEFMADVPICCNCIEDISVTEWMLPSLNDVTKRLSFDKLCWLYRCIIWSIHVIRVKL